LKNRSIMGKAPAFQLYASDFYMDTAGWTVAQVGAYTRLLMYEWVNGPIPCDMASLARIAGISDARTMYKMWLGTVGKKFISNGGNLLFNKRLEEEREKQAKRREIQTEKGKHGAEKRWKDHIAPAIAQAQPNDSSSSSSSSSSSNKEKNKRIKHIAKVEKTPSPDVKTFIDFYYEEFKKAFSTPPHIQGGKDGAITKRILSKIPIEELKELLLRYFDSTDQFILKSGYTLSVFESQINKLKIGSQGKDGMDLWLQVKEKQDETRRQEKICSVDAKAQGHILNEPQ